MRKLSEKSPELTLFTIVQTLAGVDAETCQAIFGEGYNKVAMQVNLNIPLEPEKSESEVVPLIPIFYYEDEAQRYIDKRLAPKNPGTAFEVHKINLSMYKDFEPDIQTVSCKGMVN